MLCKIADLIVDIPAADGLDRRCRSYLTTEQVGADIIIRTKLYRRGIYSPLVSDSTVAYMETGHQFHLELLNYNGFFLHSSAVVVDGKAYLFSGDSGAGKSTHTKMWLDLFPGARIINDDKPALRCIDGVWYAYGTPWCGKDGINENAKAPLAGVCYLNQADHNAIRRLDSREAMIKIMGQTVHRLQTSAQVDLLTVHLSDFLSKIPVFWLDNRPEPEAAQLSYHTMSRCAQEVNL